VSKELTVPCGTIAAVCKPSDALWASVLCVELCCSVRQCPLCEAVGFSVANFFVSCAMCALWLSLGV